MNKGKICVSVCAETAAEMLRQIRRAEDLADVIEIRFDCLKNPSGSFRHLKNLEKTLLATYRPFAQGGKRDISFQQREDFWINSHVFEFTNWADLEQDISEEKINALWGKAFEKIIKSFHDFEKVPENLESIYKTLSENDAIAKIAVQTDEITDAIPVWKLLEKAKSENKKIIPIAMGEAGKWTRILGLAHGTFLTYAAIESGRETAPGQVSAEDLIEVYRAKELDENAEVYAVIAGDTSYSMSAYLHNAAFKFHNLNSVFVPLQVKNLDEFMRRMVLEKSREIELNFRGFAVTNPHKIEIMKYLDSISEDAKKIGAVNTVKIENGKLHGCNTDWQGFVEPLKDFYGDLTSAKIAVIGNGGAARACIYALKKENAEVTIFARNIEKAKNLADEFKVKLEELPKTKDRKPKTNFKNFEIIINTTPLGTKGELENETPLFAEQIKNIHLAYDLVYNPCVTAFLHEAKSVYIPTIGGLKMLVVQAMKQFEMWTNLDAPMKEMSRAVLQKLN